MIKHHSNREQTLLPSESLQASTVPYIEELSVTRGPLGHVLDACIMCFGAIRVGMKWSSPVRERSELTREEGYVIFELQK